MFAVRSARHCGRRSAARGRAARRGALAGRRLRSRAYLALLVVLMAVVPGANGRVAAGFTTTTTNGGNSVTAAGSFPTYPAAVLANSPWAYHRGDDAASGASTSVAADASTNSRSGTYNGVTGGLSPSTQWDFDEGSGTGTADSSGSGNPGTLAANVTWVAGGRSGSAVSFPGGDPATSNYVQGPNPGVATNQSFTVMAWAYPTVVWTQNRAVVSLGSAVGNAMSLQMSTAGYWEFVMTPTENTRRQDPVAYVTSTSAVALDTWVHLAGVYNTTTGKITLYVNGTSQGDFTKSSAWNCTCQLQAGRARWDGSWFDAFTGYIDQVRTYRAALTAAEVLAISGDAPNVAYDFEETSGTSATDTSGYQNTGTLGSTVTRTATGHTGRGITLGANANSYVSSATAGVDATKAFTVSAWVKLNTSGAVSRTILSQQGTTGSTFVLRYEPGGRWAFSMAQSATGPTSQVVSTAAAAFDQWVHLVAVYTDAGGNASVHRLQLYVNNGTAVTGTHSPDYGTTNPLQVGRTMSAGTWGDPFDGQVDEVRVYRRVLTTAERTLLYTGTSPGASTPMTAGVPGALQGAQQGQQASTAVRFNGTGLAYNNLSVAAPGPNTFTLSCWFKSTGSGSLIGYSLSQTGMAAEATDRVLYLDNTGKIDFYVWDTAARHLLSGSAYHDGSWHHVAATLGPAGARLYVDGIRVAASAGVTYGRNSAGYWRWGGTNLIGLANRPGSDYFVGTIDEVAIFTAQLTDQQIAWLYHANH